MWEQLESGRVRHQFEPLILVATLAMIPVLIIEYDTTSAGWACRRRRELGDLRNGERRDFEPATSDVTGRSWSFRERRE